MSLKIGAVPDKGRLKVGQSPTTHMPPIPMRSCFFTNSGGGKTNLIVSLLTNPKLFGGSDVTDSATDVTDSVTDSVTDVVNDFVTDVTDYVTDVVTNDGAIGCAPPTTRTLATNIYIEERV